ncbi:hypothetical protein SAMN05880501_106142 [Ureibacillus xyleni]|uniref:Uncharacterized protein n=1 Tax=Ureibacillus xyleni TaxID=614648 RepID=A0A285SSJ0_9BACL|nr:hypothetical protein [Ureibacillus xyleni]SOC11383.1 hypothetical protein SAMN05880501_106142 [Ureibacillus xyleni]
MDDHYIPYQKNEMEQLRREKAAYGRKMVRVRNQDTPELTGERYLQKKERELRRRFVRILNADKNNAEVRYRYGIFLMDRKKYSRAIQKFEEAIKINDKRNRTYPLEKAQLLKAHMLIGYCAGQLLKGSLEKAEELNIEEASFDYSLKVEGREIQEVMLMLENATEHYTAYINGKKQILSLEDYLHYKAGLHGDMILISFVEKDVFIKVGQHEKRNVPNDLSALLRFQLETILEKGMVTYDDIRFEYESDRSWATHRKYVSRINELAEVEDAGEKIFKVSEGTFQNRYPQSFELATSNYIVVFRQSQFYEDIFDY